MFKKFWKFVGDRFNQAERINDPHTQGLGYAPSIGQINSMSQSLYSFVTINGDKGIARFHCNETQLPFGELSLTTGQWRTL